MPELDGGAVTNGIGPKEREDLFHRAMVSVYERARDEAGYNATRFLQMVAERGGLETARQLLNAAAVSDGFTALWEKGRLDLSVEFQMLQPQFEDLFTEDERETALQRLRDYRFDIDKHLEGAGARGMSEGSRSRR